MHKTTIAAALHDKNLLGGSFRNKQSWSTWQAVMKAAFAEPLSATELAAFKSVAGGRSPPNERVAELWVRCRSSWWQEPHGCGGCLLSCDMLRLSRQAIPWRDRRGSRARSLTTAKQNCV
jgi:hypothetical protein